MLIRKHHWSFLLFYSLYKQSHGNLGSGSRGLFYEQNICYNLTIIHCDIQSAIYLVKD